MTPRAKPVDPALAEPRFRVDMPPEIAALPDEPYVEGETAEAYLHWLETGEGPCPWPGD